MMDSIDDLLKNNPRSEPPQVAALKKHVLDKFRVVASVRVYATHYSIAVPNAAIAHKLRVSAQSIIQECNLDKKLVIRISS